MIVPCKSNCLPQYPPQHHFPAYFAATVMRIIRQDDYLALKYQPAASLDLVISEYVPVVKL